jgi:hypothetical protein
MSGADSQAIVWYRQDYEYGIFEVRNGRLVRDQIWIERWLEPAATDFRLATQLLLPE